jgi:hypothetical protein
MKLWNWGLTIVLFFSLTAALAGCGNNNSQNVNSGSSNKSADGKNEYPQEVADAFVKSCQGSGAKAEVCSCMLDKMQHKYTFEEFTVIETKMRAGRTPDDVLEFMGKARAECFK